jgi:membrane protein DedA with SNARE-associated domain
VLVKYGWVFHLTPERLARVHSWFERRGRWTLLVGYFIPGVRHLTGYVAGVSELAFRDFALFAYTGAFCWAVAFITLGYVLGEQWNRVMDSLHQTKLLTIAVAIAAAMAIVIFEYFRRRRTAKSTA